MGSKVFNINHTSIKRTTLIVEVSDDLYNPMTKIIDFEHSAVDGYFKEASQIIYGLYLDREFVREFFDKTVKIQLQSMDVSYGLEVFAHPHAGFQFVRASEVPGNKIRIRFRAKKSELADIMKHSVYHDGATGTYLEKKAGEVDAATGEVSGWMLKSGGLV